MRDFPHDCGMVDTYGILDYYYLDKIRNKRIRGTSKLREITKKVQEMRLRWYGNVMRREEHYVGRRVMEIKVERTRK